MKNIIIKTQYTQTQGRLPIMVFSLSAEIVTAGATPAIPISIQRDGWHILGYELAYGTKNDIFDQ